MNRTLIVTGLVVLLAGCEAEIEQVELAKEDLLPLDATADLRAQVKAPEVALCESGRSYKGFGGNDLSLDRREAEVGLERARTKPFTALLTEYPRVLGSTPELLAQSESTFGLTPARWYPKTDPSAVSLYQAYRIAFQGCLALTNTGTQFTQLPTVESATAQCTSWARRFWSRGAMGPEIESCAKVIGVYSSSETSLRRRWAHGCASVLTSSDFLTF